jgi:hypothetical protein
VETICRDRTMHLNPMVSQEWSKRFDEQIVPE